MFLFADEAKDLPKELPFWWEVTKTVGIPLISGVLAAIVSYFVAQKGTRTQRRLSLDQVQNKLIELALQYPHLERNDYCDGWPHKQPDPMTKEWLEERERYDNFCCFVFNMIHQNWLLASKKAHKIEDMLSIKEYILRHYCWWEEEDENINFYESDFCTFVDGIIREFRREGKIKKKEDGK
jgi:hypothetical protein